MVQLQMQSRTEGERELNVKVIAAPKYSRRAPEVRMKKRTAALLARPFVHRSSTLLVAAWLARLAR
jgi:hypothetical protein